MLPKTTFDGLVRWVSYYPMTFLAGMLLLCILIHLDELAGFNRLVSSKILKMVNAMTSLPLSLIHEYYKRTMNSLTKTEFDEVKMWGTVPTVRHTTKNSRGYDKLEDILRQTGIKPTGTVLSLCAGRGGWEQVISANPDVKTIHTFTLGSGPGHAGHEDFRDWNWPGREKVQLSYADVTLVPPIDHDTLLFDGGESHPNPLQEADKFWRLLHGAVGHQFTEKTKVFVVKILVPTDPRVMELMNKIQETTGRGDLVRCTHSRLSTMELYFVSGKKTNLSSRVRLLLKDTFNRGLQLRNLEPTMTPGPTMERSEEVERKFMLPSPNYTHTISRLGNPILEERRKFVHWQSLGVYPYGNTGTALSRPVDIAHDLTVGLADNLPGMSEWMATDTTPEGFTEVFRGKVDKPPREKHMYNEHLRHIYQGMADHFTRVGFRVQDLTDGELIEGLNKRGAPGYTDLDFNNIASYLSTDWKSDQRRVQREIDEDKLTQAVFNTIGKREKKTMKGKVKGSRMVAFLPIPMRVYEARKFGCLLQLTKPSWNKFGVGGMGLHDLGMRLDEVWKGAATSSDIAGFDTKVSATMLSYEMEFLHLLGADTSCEMLYRVYGNPLILVPRPGEHVRSELLSGRGQRMSGSITTYAMNTITRIAIGLAQFAESQGLMEEDLRKFAYTMMGDGKFMTRDGRSIDCRVVGGCVSGDDEVFTSTIENVEKYADTGRFLETIGFPRKNLAPNAKTRVSHEVYEVEFCSHHYERVSYFDENTGVVHWRYMPTRDVAEIIGKARLWLGGPKKGKEAEAWISAQGNNLLVNYHHLKTARALGVAYKAVSDPNIILIERGWHRLANPWMREGEILDVVNAVLFGDGTNYPKPGFCVHKMAHLGYLPAKAEISYDPGTNHRSRSLWRQRLSITVARTIRLHDTGGSTDFMSNWRPIRKL